VVLTEEEKSFTHRAFYRGPAAFTDEGWDAQELRAFLEREDVQYELALLKREFDLNDGFNARAKVAARRGLHQLLDAALAVTALGLSGPEYQRDKKTGTVCRDARGLPILINPEITRSQQWAADKVLNGAGVHDFRIGSDPGIDNNVDLLFKKAETPRTVDTTQLGQSDAERTLSLERVRTAIDKLSQRLPAARERFREEFAEIVKDGRGGKRKTKKRVAKKAKKKATRKTSRSGKTR